MTQFLSNSELTAEALTALNPGLVYQPSRLFGADGPTEPYVRVMYHYNHPMVSVGLTVLPIVNKLLDLMDWGLFADIYGRQLVAQRRHALMNEAVIANKHEVKERFKTAQRNYRTAVSLWESVKHIRPVQMDYRMVNALVDGARHWPEVMNVAYDGGSFEDFDGHHEAVAGEILIRFWPVLFRDYDHQHTRGLSGVMDFHISPEGHISHDIGNGGGDYQLHPHIFTDGSVCNGEARFGEGQLLALKELRNWWVGTDHSPANGGRPWSYQSSQWWDEHGGDFWNYYGLQLAGWAPEYGPPAVREAYYIEAPETSYEHHSTAEDREAEAVTIPVDEQILATIVAEYNADSEEDEYYAECYECGDNLTEDDAYYCDYCDHSFCDDHYHGDSYCNECWRERHYTCQDCGHQGPDDDSYRCNSCGNSFCEDCVEYDKDAEAYCASCKRRGHGEWEDDEDADADRTPLPGQVTLSGEVYATTVTEQITVTPLEPQGPFREDYYEDRHGTWECEYPSHKAYNAFDDTYRTVCRAVARRVHGPRPGTATGFPVYDGDDCHMLCETHWQLLPNRGAFTAQLVVPQEPTMNPVADGWEAFDGVLLECCHPECSGLPAAYRKDRANFDANRTWEHNPHDYMGEYACEAHVPRVAAFTFETEWPDGETNLSARGRDDNWHTGTEARLWTDGPGNIWRRGASSVQSDAFRRAVIEAEYANRDFREVYDRLASYGEPYDGDYKEDYKPISSILGYGCEHNLFTTEHCQSVATWQRNPITGGPSWFCDYHYGKLPSNAAVVPEEVR